MTVRLTAPLRVWRVGLEFVMLFSSSSERGLIPFLPLPPSPWLVLVLGAALATHLVQLVRSPVGTRPCLCWVGKNGKGQARACGQHHVGAGTQLAEGVTGLSGSSPSPISFLSFSSEDASLVLLCQALVYVGRKASGRLQPMSACPWGGLSAGLPSSLVPPQLSQCPTEKEQLTPLCHVTSQFFCLCVRRGYELVSPVLR